MPLVCIWHPMKTSSYWSKILLLLFLLTVLVPSVLDLALAQFINPNGSSTKEQVWVRIYHNVWWIYLVICQIIVTVHYKKQVKANKKMNKIAKLQIWLVIIKSLGSLESVYWLVSNFMVQVGLITNLGV